MGSGTEPPDLLRLNDLLWRYRRGVARFVFLLDVQLLIVEAGRHDQQPHVTGLLHELADALVLIDRDRRTVVGTTDTLTALAASAADPWPGILVEHRDSLRDALAEADRLRRRNQRAVAAVTDGLDRLFDTVGAHGADIDTARPPVGHTG
ncbi:MAG: hypothetical protein ACK5RL_20845 [Acidimicrobiales bacterium]